jgi:hypothetical protein
MRAAILAATLFLCSPSMADSQYIRSVRNAPMKQAIGIGTRMGWIG